MKIPVVIYDQIYIPRFPEISDFLADLRSRFTHKNPDYYKLKRLGKFVGNIDEHISTWKNVIYENYGPCLAIPRGGMKKVRELADVYDIELSLLDRRISLSPIQQFRNDVELWPIQATIARLAFIKQNCLINAPTGSGKTMILLKIAEWILRTSGPVLIVVWEGNRESGLFKQWIDRINMCFGLIPSQIGMLGDGVQRIKPITVAMQQTLRNHVMKYGTKFGGVLCDEIQRFAAPSFQELINFLPCKYRIGASADEKRKDQKEFLIYDAFGEIAGKAEKTELVRQGKIMDVTIRVIPTDFDLIYENNGKKYRYAELEASNKNYKELIDHICPDTNRNNLIWEFLSPCLEAEKTTIVGTQRVDHAKYWDRRIRNAGYNCGLLLGGKKQANEFETTVNSLRARKIRAGIGTIQKIAQGHDIPALDRGFIITPLASNKQVLNQFTGRLRRTAEGKDDAVLYYVWDKYVVPYHINVIKSMFKNNAQILVDGEFIAL